MATEGGAALNAQFGDHRSQWTLSTDLRPMRRLIAWSGTSADDVVDDASASSALGLQSRWSYVRLSVPNSAPS